ncbi:MAG: type IV pili twitching motility protein PilT, partial [Candidatus Levybacteria bacterium CG10_big_fil_rev_8_21_14_0_10_36_30]
STTIASIVNEINMNQAANIITIEDPIEYIYGKGKSIISQREIGSDTHSWDESLRSALRQDPDVVVIGEMRDFESVSSAITIAETGHLVFSTLHTNSAAQSVDRIIDAFPEHQQNQVRTQLSETLEGIISQRLIPRLDGGRVVATEILLGTNAVKSNIRDGKTHMLDSIIENSQDAGMIPLEVSLANLVKQGQVALEVAQQYALRQDSFIRLIG